MGVLCGMGAMADEMETRYRVPTVTDNLNISYPRAVDSAPMTVSAKQVQTFSEGSYTVWMLEGDVSLQQGADTFQAEKMVLWEDTPETDEAGQTCQTVLAYLEGNVRIAFVTPKTTSRVRGKQWSGRLQTSQKITVEASQTVPLETIPHEYPLYQASRKQLFQSAELLLTQLSTPVSASGAPTSTPPGVVIPGGALQPPTRDPAYAEVLTRDSVLTQGNVSALDPNTLRPGQLRVDIQARNDTRPQVSVMKEKTTEKTVLIYNGGVNIVIEGADQFLKKSSAGNSLPENLPALGTLDIVADQLVIWLPPNFQELLSSEGGMSMGKEIPMELYMEGNIIFRQGDQEIQAERMYFDVQTGRGIIREAEVFASIPKFEGLVRLRAEEIRMPEHGMLVANDTFVTTSRIGDPVYRFQLDQLMVRNQRQPKVDPQTGQPILDPRTREPLLEGPHDVTGRGAVVKVGSVPVFYLPYFKAPLENPSNIINKVSFRKDSIFGYQPMIGMDAYRLFGVRNPIEGTDWDLNALYYTKRGFGVGSKFTFDRYSEGFAGTKLFGHRYGFVQFDGIHDTGRDNLGLDRYDLIPSKKWRYQLIGQRRVDFGNNMELRGQLGLISDRNYQQEYFQNSWYTEPDRATQLELRQTLQNMSWALWADVRLNDFHTQTQRLPQAEFYWIGQPLCNDLLTWSSYSQVGYTHLYPDTQPTDPNDAALWNLLPWEENRRAARASTRHELSYPFQAGPIKFVPFALGEVAYWGENLYGDSVSRLYGQAGLRGSLPFWKYYDLNSQLFNLKGVMHKVEFDVEASVAGTNRSAYELPLYDLLDDREILDFRHHMQSAIFAGSPIPSIYDSRTYAIRSNLGGWVTSPSTELAEDLLLVRFGMHHRWQTKRGQIGAERIVDWVTLDMNFNLYPDYDRDNFGTAIGLLDYDLRWHPGDRLMLYTSGNFDFFSGGLKMVDVGAVLNRPSKGKLFTSLHVLSGPVENVVMRVGYNYWMSPKWASTFETTFDVSGKGNLGERLSLTRIGESFLFTMGASYDGPSNDVGCFFTLEPRFGKKGNTAKLFDITPPGLYGVD